MVWLTQLVFYGLPWLQWGERQMVLFDLGARRFYLFGLVLYPQDFIYLTGLLICRRCRCSCSRPWPGGCGAVLPARRRCTPSCSCGWKTASKATAAPACAWTRRRGPRLRSSGQERPQATGLGVPWRCGPALPLWATLCPFAGLGAEIWRCRARWQIFWVFFYGFRHLWLCRLICASRCANTCAPMHAFKAPCSTRTRSSSPTTAPAR